MDFQILIPPAIGAVIGYITNDIAIKMLFHPRKPIYIGKWQLPFTPGLIPKEKSRVARSIGRVVSTQLLNRDTLINVLTSEEMTGKIRSALEKLVEDNRNNESTLEEILVSFAPAETVDNAVFQVRKSLTGLIYSKLTSMHFGETISMLVLQKVNQSMGGYLKGFGFGLFDENLINSLAGNIGELIDKGISDHSEEIVEALVDKETDKLLNMRLCDILSQYEDKIPTLIESLLRIYVSVIETNLDHILRGVDIGKIVEDRVDSFDVEQLEAMIFGIMKKELNAIVYLGALLGFLMGWVTPLLGM